MRTFGKKTQVSRQAEQPASSKTKRPFFDQSHTPEPFFQRQPEARKAEQPDSKLNSDKRLRRLDFSAVTRPPSDARLRVPSSGEIQGMLSSGKVDEAVVLSRVRKLLERMNRERKLKGVINIDITMHELFPIPGVLDQAAFERYIDTANREMVYKSVQEAYTTPRENDRENLKRGLESAAGTAGLVANDNAGLEAVFGTGRYFDVTMRKIWGLPTIQAEKYVTIAQRNYRKIHVILNELANKIATNITTDYNLDAQEIFLNGSAVYKTQRMHLKSEIVAYPLAEVSMATFIHEGAHLADPNIMDYGYYGRPGFEPAAGDTKINNAAHYEELPRRLWGISLYRNQSFTPGITSSGKASTMEEKIMQNVVDYYRMARGAAADVHRLLRRVYIKQLDGKISKSDCVYQLKETVRLLEVSRLMDLTLHEQKTWPPKITLLDITTTESIARGIGQAQSYIKKLPQGTLPNFDLIVPIISSLSVDEAMVAYGGILGDAKRDRKLLDWLNAHYHNVYP